MIAPTDQPDFYDRVRRRDRLALEQLFRQLLPQIRNYAIKHVREYDHDVKDQLVEDITQICCGHIIDKIEQFQGASYPQMVLWAKQIVFSQSKNFMKKYLVDKKREAAEMPEDNDHRFTLMASPRHEAYTREVQRAGLDCIEALQNERHRLAFVLYHFGNLNHQQIAERLNTTVTNVSTMISRAKQAVKTCLQGKGHSL